MCLIGLVECRAVGERGCRGGGTLSWLGRAVIATLAVVPACGLLSAGCNSPLFTVFGFGPGWGVESGHWAPRHWIPCPMIDCESDNTVAAFYSHV